MTGLLIVNFSFLFIATMLSFFYKLYPSEKKDRLGLAGIGEIVFFF